jgi:hypothetical protein
MYGKASSSEHAGDGLAQDAGVRGAVTPALLLGLMAHHLVDLALEDWWKNRIGRDKIGTILAIWMPFDPKGIDRAIWQKPSGATVLQYICPVDALMIVYLRILVPQLFSGPLVCERPGPSIP